MYAFPEVLKEFKQISKDIKFQKGCFNFKSLENIDLLKFQQFLKDSEEQNFYPVINHYKNMKK